MRTVQPTNYDFRTDNPVHNKVALALNAFTRILADAPEIDVSWAFQTSLKLAKINYFSNEHSIFASKAIDVLVKEHL